MTTRPAVMDRVAAIREQYLADGVELAYSRTIEVLRDRKARNADTLMAADKMFKAGHQYQPAAAAEKTIEHMSLPEIERDTARRMAELLVEVQHGRYETAEPLPEEGIFG